MKLSCKSDTGLRFCADKPDEHLSNYFAKMICETMQKEQVDFAAEVGAAFRNLKPGKKRVLKSKPIVVTIEKGTT